MFFNLENRLHALGWTLQILKDFWAEYQGYLEYYTPQAAWKIETEFIKKYFILTRTPYEDGDLDQDGEIDYYAGSNQWKAGSQEVQAGITV